MRTRFSHFALCAGIGAMIAATPALAAEARASFTVDAAGPTVSIEVQSWSWGASNGGTVATAREAGSGMATGRRMHKPLWVNGPLDGNGSVTIATPAGSKQACTVGQHFGSLTLDSPTEKVSLSDLTVMKCTSDGMTLAYTTAAAQPATKATKTRSNIQNN